MRPRSILLAACLVSCTSARRKPAPGIPSIPSHEYAGVYVSTPQEDYFTPCGIDGVGDTWSLNFRDGEPEAPFLKGAPAIRGDAELTHFIRIRGRLGPPGLYNLGFQTRVLTVDSVLDVKESLEPCKGFGVPAGWSGFRENTRDQRAIALSTDRRLVAMMDDEGQISVWSTPTAKRVKRFASPDKGNPRPGSAEITFSDDGNLLAVGGSDRFVRIWRVRNGRTLFSLPLKDSAAVAREIAKIPPRRDSAGYTPPTLSNAHTQATQIVFNKRGTMLATTNQFSTIVWSMKTGKKVAEFPVGNDLRRKAFFVGDESLLLTADNGHMTLRSILHPELVVPLGARAAETDLAAISPDGRTIVVGTWSDSVFLWPVTGDPARVLHVPGSSAQATAFSPDGNIIALVGAGLYLYDVHTGAPIRAFRNLPDPLSRAWFSTDGKSIVTLSTFDDRFRIVYLDPKARPANENVFDDSLTAQLSLAPPPTTGPRTVGGLVTGPNKRAVADAEVAIINGDAPAAVIARTTTSPGGYFSFNGIRFRHVLVRVRKSGFAPAVRYIHLTGREDDGPWGVELTASASP
jgi:WD40 repeat protein